MDGTGVMWMISGRNDVSKRHARKTLKISRPKRTVPFIPEEKKLPAKSTVETKKHLVSWSILADGWKCAMGFVKKKIHKDVQVAHGFYMFFLPSIWVQSFPNFRRSKSPRNTEVTILTGFLGAGKTTLLNYILEETGNRNRFQQIQF